MKKILFFLTLAVITVGFASAQEPLNNWISGEVSLLGMGVRYERMYNNNISFGGTAFFHSFFDGFFCYGVNFTSRYYPKASVFYAEIGIGFGMAENDVVVRNNILLYEVTGVMFSPGIGWRIDIGEPGGFYINPMIIMPIVIGESRSVGSNVGTNLRLAFGMGHAF